MRKVYKNVENKNAILFLINYFFWKKRFISKRQRSLKLMIFVIKFHLPNPLLLVIILDKKRRYEMTEYSQS